MAIKINDGGITKRLEAIRIAIGANKANPPYTPRPPARRIEVDLEGKSVESLFHPSGLLIKNNQPVFAYIRDHSFVDFFRNTSMFPGNKIHFTVCQKLLEMRSKGRWDRYRITNRDDDRYDIDTREGEREERLYPCKYCLGNVDYQCYKRLSWRQENEKNDIVKSFNAKDAMDLLRQQFDIFRAQVASLKPAGMPTGYAYNHTNISRAYRAHKNYTCEKCSVNLNHARGCIDTHHIKGNKNDNRYENLQCLCKLCHAKEHPHYRPSLGCRQIIKQAREMQGITNRGH